jgi:hypothetical protein
VWQFLKKILVEHVLTPALGTAIVASGLLVWLAPETWWSSLWGTIRAVANFFGESTTLPNWLLAILIVITLVFVIGLIVLGIAIVRDKPTPNPIADYLSDYLIGMVWRWQYGSGGDIYGLAPFCPHCDFQIHPRFASPYKMIECYSFRCDHCGQLNVERNESLQETESLVIRLIQQKLRNGDWQTASKRT